MLTWETLIEAEPRLLDLHNEVTAVKDDGQAPAFCANDLWYGTGSFRDQLSLLVGWNRSEEEDSEQAFLTTEEAYDIAYDALYDLLPPCRNCGCLGSQGKP